MEIWKPIKGYEGLYDVSNLGRVKSRVRNIVDKNGNSKYYHEIVLKPHVCGGGYLGVSLYSDDKSRTKHIHRLVVESFIKNENNHPQVNHIDENKLNNQLCNLEWSSLKHNNNHGTRGLRISNALSKRLGQYSLDGELLKVWKSTLSAERNGGFSAKLISRTCLGKSKSHSGYKWKYTENNRGI